jgi:predicted transcriptional regulator
MRAMQKQARDVRHEVMTVRVNRGTQARLKAAAETHERSMAGELRHAISQYLERVEEEAA